jgi:hypothetical protein
LRKVVNAYGNQDPFVKVQARTLDKENDRQVVQEEARNDGLIGGEHHTLIVENDDHLIEEFQY